MHEPKNQKGAVTTPQSFLVTHIRNPFTATLEALHPRREMLLPTGTVIISLT